MDKYIGIDVHARSCTLAVVDGAGKRIGQHVIETNGASLVECLRMIPGPRHLCIEEGTQSAWLYEILSPHVQELAVVNVSDSHGQKSDWQGNDPERWRRYGRQIVGRGSLRLPSPLR